MELINSVSELRGRLKPEHSIAFVPTMGNLHAGHLALVEIARQHDVCVVASIFVNRLQFEPGGDFERYPRTLDNDCKLLERAGCHVVFAPHEREVYPVEQEIVVMPPKVALPLEGEFRPGHFEGVATIVSKLFNLVTPTVAVFGKKDYQQLQMVRAIVSQLNFPVRIVGAETVREADGLALSSRNAYLGKDERVEAVRLIRNLRNVVERVQSGERDFNGITAEAQADLSGHGWKPDYVSIRNRSTLLPANPGEGELVVVAAATLGRTRLIDNLEIQVPGTNSETAMDLWSARSPA